MNSRLLSTHAVLIVAFLAFDASPSVAKRRSAPCETIFINVADVQAESNRKLLESGVKVAGYTIEDVENLSFDQAIPSEFKTRRRPNPDDTIIDGVEYPLLIRAKSEDGELLVSDLVGRRAVFREKQEGRWLRIWEEGGKPSVLYERVEREVPLAAEPAAPPDRDFAPRFWVPLMGTKELALRQLESSGSWKFAGDKKTSNRLLRSQISANKDMLQILRSGRALSLKDIQRWNRLIDAAEHEDDQDRAISGVLRGTTEERVIGNTRYVVNLQGTSNLIMLAPKLGLPVTSDVEVAHRTEQLLTWVNALGRGSSPIEAISIFRELVRIHGFPGAHGRTGRVLLDYCLMKMGLPPAPRGMTMESMGLYVSEHEALQNLNGAYSKAEPLTRTARIRKFVRGGF